MSEISQEARDAALLLDRPHGRDRGERTIQDVIDKRDEEWQKTLDHLLEDQARLEWVIDNQVVMAVGGGKLDLFKRDRESGKLIYVLHRDDHDFRAALDDARKQGA